MRRLYLLSLLRGGQTGCSCRPGTVRLGPHVMFNYSGHAVLIHELGCRPKHSTPVDRVMPGRAGSTTIWPSRAEIKCTCTRNQESAPSAATSVPPRSAPVPAVAALVLLHACRAWPLSRQSLSSSSPHPSSSTLATSPPSQAMPGLLRLLYHALSRHYACRARPTVPYFGLAQATQLIWLPL